MSKTKCTMQLVVIYGLVHFANAHAPYNPPRTKLNSNPRGET